jgi:hypothetical protein
VQSIGKFLAAICAVLFILSGVMVLLLFNIERKAFSSETYKQAFEDQSLYERMPSILATALAASIAQHQSSIPFLGAVRVEDWQNVIVILLPPEELKVLGNDALDSTFDYLNGKTDFAAISLLPVKSRLVGESGINVVMQLLSLQPPCTVEQLTQMALGLLSGEIALCNPPPEAMGLMAPVIESQLQTLVTVFPDEVTFISDTRSGTPEDPRLSLNTVRAVITFTPAVPALFLFGIVVFAVRSLKDWFIWWGWPLMLTGLISLLLAGVGSPLVGWILQFLIQTQVSSLIPPILGASIAETASAVARQMLTPVILQGIVLAVLGLTAMGAGFLLAKRERDQIIQSMYINTTRT